MSTAREIMTPDVECVKSTENLVAAARRMSELGVGALPICGEDDRLQGIVTDRDIVIKIVAEELDPAKTKVSEIAEGKPVTVDADADASEVVAIMIENKIRRVPVIEDKQLVGMISQADIARSLDPEEVGALLAALSE